MRGGGDFFWCFPCCQLRGRSERAGKIRQEGADRHIRSCRNMMFIQQTEIPLFARNKDTDNAWCSQRKKDIRLTLSTPSQHAQR
jgi:hypothetical protein